MVVFNVVEEVLLRLHVKDLLRFKSVCKLWYSLISSPSFVRLQCKHICNKEDNRRIAMCLPYTYTHNARVLEWHYYHNWSIGGSSNGLVCMYDSFWPENPIRVTNPLTRKFRELRKPPRLDFARRRCLGFGYDSSTDDYKVVMAIYKYSDRRTLVYILYLKSNIWKLLGHFNYNINYNDTLDPPGILFNGALHWFWFDANYTTNKALIVSFDLAKEEFREIPQPDDARYVWGYRSTLAIIEGRLCIYTGMIYANNNPPFSIWAMKNYDVKPSWELLPITNPSEMRTCEKYIWSPIFVQTLVSPFVNNGRPSYAKNNNNTVKAGSVKEKGETEEEENGSKQKRKIIEILPEEEGEGGKRTSQRISI